jgi:hypothetical protein
LQQSNLIGQAEGKCRSKKTFHDTLFVYNKNLPKSCVGPSEVPILDEGQVYPAYLMKEEKGTKYAPVAGGYSFTEMK